MLTTIAWIIGSIWVVAIIIGAAESLHGDNRYTRRYHGPFDR